MAQQATAEASRGTAADADRRLRIVRTFAAPREAVFRAWTDPAQVAKWWGPKDFTVPEIAMDVRPGGKWRTCMRSPDGADLYVRGVFREIVAPERLVLTWAWETDGEPGHETVITVEFHERGGETELILTQELFEAVEGRDNHRQGWTSSFECLDEQLSGR